MSQKLQRILSTDTCDLKIAGLYDLGETIGKGHFAVVKLAQHVFTGEYVAVKVIDKTKLDLVSKEHLFQEVICMKLVKHPNVVQLYEVIDTVNKLYLILELGDGGDLYDYIVRHEFGLTEDAAKRYFSQMVTAIAYCHKLHVCHRDLKPENVVFFEKRGIVKLTDFGFSNQFVPGENLQTSCGSLAYSAPEILLGDSYDATKVDIWSLGVILFMLVCGRLPFQEANDSETLARIMDCKYNLPEHLSAACANLIGKLLQREPDKRAALDDILKDEWLQDAAMDAAAAAAVALPLIVREHVTEKEREEILALMVAGEVATREEILAALECDQYDHLTSTYYLLAERRLRRRGSSCNNHLIMSLGNSAQTSAAPPPPPHHIPSVPSQPAVTSSTPAVTAEEKLRRFSMILEDEEDEMDYEVGVGGAHDGSGGASSLTMTNRSLHSVKSSPQLLHNICEEKVMLEDVSCTLRNRMATTQRMVNVASPTYLRRLHARRVARAATWQNSSRSSSDNSDTEDGPYSSSGRLRRRLAATAHVDTEYSSDPEVGNSEPASDMGSNFLERRHSCGAAAASSGVAGGSNTTASSASTTAGKCAPISEEAEDGLVNVAPREIEHYSTNGRRSVSADTTPARSLHIISQLSLNSSSVTQSNFSLCSLASSLRSNKMMAELFRETLELVVCGTASAAAESAECDAAKRFGSVCKTSSSICSYSSACGVGGVKTDANCAATAATALGQQQPTQQVAVNKRKLKLPCCVLS